jgi:hypothetical protein
MNRIITIQNSLGRYDNVSPFLIANDNLKFQFKGLKGKSEFYAIFSLNGKVKKVLLNDDKTTEISSEWLEVGELNINVLVYSGGFKTAEYAVEPLAIGQLNYEFKAQPVIAALIAKQNELEKTQAEYEKRLQEMERKVNGYKIL